MPFCSECGSDLAVVRFCPKSGKPIAECEFALGARAAGAPEGSAAAARPGSSAVSDQNLMAALAYLAIPAIIFLLVEPYRSNSFIRFHSWQSIAFWLILLGLQIAFGIMISAIPFLFFLLPLQGLAMLALFVLWIVLIIQAARGAEFRLPAVGDWAAERAARSVV